ncbi:MAG: hypothetical protein QOH79_2665 [Acidimicrobiaceae bacterium]|jgi:hypothetical protein
MRKGTVGEARLHVDAAPDALYDLVSDVTRMGEWSPETIRCEWLDGASGPAPGVRFKGTNKRGFARWSTKPEVIEAERGRVFSFVTHSSGPSTKWTYRFEPAEGGGTELVESFEMLDDPSRALNFIERHVMRIADRKADLEAGMQRTLERIKAVAETRH